jgi:2-succinyl-5-enolpyruvyl-6-hydroxy-3-cyclohexene-1-carboxylate synthase
MINPNIQWSFILAQQFRYLDIEDIVICSGSRNSPLTLAFNDIENFNCHSFIDERSAAFFAIGLAKNSNKPVILISTSGTAVGNFYPAIMG